MPETIDIDSLRPLFERMLAACETLPEVAEHSWFGFPSLKVRKKFLGRVKDAETIVITCPLDEKVMLLELAPEIYFETDHYRGWPAILVRIGKIADDELAHRLQRAWLAQAPKTLIRKWEAARGT